MKVIDWKQKGNVYLWRYEDASKGQSGWHLTADAEGASSLIALIDMLLQTDREAHRTVRLTKPAAQELRVPGFQKKAVAAEKLVLRSRVDENRFWALESDDKMG